MASHGRFYKVYQELAGLSGDAQHYKMEGEVQTSRSFGLGYVCFPLSVALVFCTIPDIYNRQSL